MQANMVSFNMFFIVSLMAAGVILADASANEICCPMSWLGYGGHCYRYYTYKMNFAAARQHCKSVGSDLVSIHSDFENNIVKTLSYGKQIWLGLSDKREDETYEWSDGTPTTYTNWNSDQPNDGGTRGQDCVGMSWFTHPKGNWHDIGCSSQFDFVCKM